MRRTSWSNVMSRSGWLDWANFCPTGDCFLWTVYKKLKKYAAHIFGLLFHNCFDKNVGSILGDFFTNSSGHTAHDHFFFLSLFCLSLFLFFLSLSACVRLLVFLYVSVSVSVYLSLCFSLCIPPPPLCVYVPTFARHRIYLKLCMQELWGSAHRNLRTRKRTMTKNWRKALMRQGKFIMVSPIAGWD
jgi:hypothetical protein